MTSNARVGSLTKSPKKTGGAETGIEIVRELDCQELGEKTWEQQACLGVEGQPRDRWVGPAAVRDI